MKVKLKSVIELRDGTASYTYEPTVNVPYAVGINYSTPKPKKLYNKGSKYHK